MPNWTPEARAKMSALARSRYQDPIYYAKWYNACKTATNTHEEKNRRSEAAKRQFSTPEGRTKASLAAKKRYKDPAERERSRVAAKKQFENPVTREKHALSLKIAYSHPATKAKMSEHAKTRWSNPDERERLSKRLKDPKTRNAISKASKARWAKPEFRAMLSGENSSQWRGGISFEPYCPKFNNDLRNRVRQYFNGECIVCGKRGTDCKKDLSVHHIEYDKSACCNDKPVQFAALCGSCHSKTNHDRARWEAMFHRCIDEIWGGRSYYTKEEYAEICQHPEEDARPC